MDLNRFGHLTYCTNIHPGETWEEVFISLINYVLPIKNIVSPNRPFGVGLRLSNYASLELIKENNLKDFKRWLEINNVYVFTINGFPYGGFHGITVKDKVHYPDWTSPERLAYTLRLSKILADILPDGMEGGISTSPISYKPWLEEENESRERIMNDACNHLGILIEELAKIEEQTGKTIHIDIEPEPDGLIEDADELVDFFNFYLVPHCKNYLKQQLQLNSDEARSAIKNHIRACYDVCHHALAYETPIEVLKKYQDNGILIGKIQISAALKVYLGDNTQRIQVRDHLRLFEESTYLHQVIERIGDKKTNQYTDLPIALKDIMNTEGEEWRVHFHVPLFVHKYGILESTQEEIVKILELHKQTMITHHLEIETYTWDVLPQDLKQNLVNSIIREIEWVKSRLL